MLKNTTVLLLIVGILILSFPLQAQAQFGIFDIIGVIRSVFIVNNIFNLNLSGNIPHNFPFGGPILTQESACNLSFRAWFPVCVFVCVMIPTPNISVVPFGDALRIGTPGVPVTPPNTIPYGRILRFPFISDTYAWQTHNRSGPWALGLGFTPFPIDEINDALDDIRFPNPVLPCNLQYPFCVDNISISCKDSGETDQNGDPIYKVIRLLGTSNMNAPSSVFPVGYPR